MTTLQKKDLKFEFSRPSLAIVLLFTLWALYKLTAPFLIALATGSIITLVLWPVHKKIIELFPKCPRWLSSFLLCSLAFVGLLIPATLVIWIAAKDGLELMKGLDWTRFYTWINSDTFHLALPFNINIEAEQIKKFFLELSNSVFSVGTNLAGHIIATLPNNLLSLLLTILSCFFFIKDGPSLLDWTDKRIPQSNARSTLVETLIQSTFGSVGASVVAALVQALLVALAFLICGVPNVIVFSVVAFIGALFPMVGAAPIWIGGCIYLYFHGANVQLIMMIVFGIVISLSDYVVRPMMFKNSRPLHPLIVLTSIFGGLSWLGAMGVFLGPILAALILSVIDIWAQKNPDTKLS